MPLCLRKWGFLSSLCSIALALACSPASQAQSQALTHHAVSTRSAQAQAAFDRGLTLVYAFAPEAAQRSFERAARLDSHLAMAYWGKALALGSNFNIGVSVPREQEAYTAIQHALRLAQYANAEENALIAALATRYSGVAKADRGKLAAAYRDSMRGVSARYPEDLDAATLFAGAILEVSPPDVLYREGKPSGVADELSATLERVLGAQPGHIGANHYYIHAVEASLHPERAVTSGEQLLAATFEPAASHLMHMPAHVFARTGAWPKVVAANARALAAEREYLRESGRKERDSHSDYHAHNLAFLIFGYAEEGLFAQMREATANEAEPDFLLEGMIALARWDDILAFEDGTVRDPALALVARGLALAATGEIAPAQDALKRLDAQRKENPELVKIGKDLIEARLARASGEKQKELGRLQAAYESLVAGGYGEPPDFYYLRVSQTYGAALLRAGNARAAQTIFRAQLEQTPNDPLALAGLREALGAAQHDRDTKQH